MRASRTTSRLPSAHRRVRMLAAALLLLLILLASGTGATNVRWINPERGRTSGGNTVHIKGVDFKHTGLGPLSCRFHEKEVPAKVVSTTLLQCVVPGAPRPAEVEVVVLENGTRQLSGAALVYQYFECDSRECYIGDFVPSDQPLLAPGEGPPPDAEDPVGAEADEEKGEEAEVEVDEEETTVGEVYEAVVRVREDVRGEVEWAQAEESSALPPLGEGAIEEQHVYNMPDSAPDQEVEQSQGVGGMERMGDEDDGGRQEAGGRDVAGTEEQLLEEEAAAVMEDEVVWVAGCVAALLLGLGGVYTVLLQTLGVAGKAMGSFLPEVGSKGGDAQGYQGNTSTEDTMIETEGSSVTTSSNMALERSASSRPNHSGVRKQADLKRFSTYDGEDETVPLSHLCWLLGSDGPALQKLQSILADVTAGRIRHTEIVHKLQGLDAQRLLHSESVCAKALVHAGLSESQAEKVSAEIYRNETGRESDTDAPYPSVAKTARPVMPTSPASSSMGSPRMASPRPLSRTSSLENSFRGASSPSMCSSSMERDHSGLVDTSLEDALLGSFSPSPPPQRRDGMQQHAPPSLMGPALSETPLKRFNASNAPAAPDKTERPATFSPGPITCPPPSDTSRSSGVSSPQASSLSEAASPLCGNGGTVLPQSARLANASTISSPGGTLSTRSPPTISKALHRAAKPPVSSPPRAPTTGGPSPTFSPMRPPHTAKQVAPALHLRLRRLQQPGAAEQGENPASRNAFSAGALEDDDWN